jgi:hypothetical protein
MALSIPDTAKISCTTAHPQRLNTRFGSWASDAPDWLVDFLPHMVARVTGSGGDQ